MTRNGNTIKHLIMVLGITLTLLVACTTPAGVTPEPTPTPTEEQRIIATMAPRFGVPLFPSRAECVEAVDDGSAKQCVFPTGIEPFTRPEWEQLFPNTDFYLVDIGSWRSREELLAHEGQNGGIKRHLVAWQDGRAYRSETFDRLLEANAITITDTNRELVARSFALTSIPNYLGGDVRFLEWGEIEPGTYRHNYSHSLKAWTEVWGCEVLWWFAFKDQQLSTIFLGGGPCHVSEYGDYVEDREHFAHDCEGVPLGVPPHSKDYNFKR